MLLKDGIFRGELITVASVGVIERLPGNGTEIVFRDRWFPNKVRTLFT